MSELNAIKIELNNHGKPIASIQGTTSYYGISPNDTFYRQEDADRYIDLIKDKLKHKSEELANTCRFYEDELRHQKYKRCLAMAKWCKITAWFYGGAVSEVLNMDITNPLRQKVFRRLRHYKKWHKRWLELAEKFKEATMKKRNPKRTEPSNIYAIARARTQESIGRVNKKRKRTKDTYTPEAYEEHKEQCRARSKAYAATPEGKEAHRKTAHAWYEAHKRDKTFIERRKRNQARYRKKVKADPVKNAARKEYMHDYCAKRYAKQKAELESWK